MKHFLKLLPILFLLFIGVSCSNDDDDPAPVITTFKAELIPLSDAYTTATGSATLLLNQTAKTFEITIIYAGFKPTHSYIRSSSGVPIFNLSEKISSSPSTNSFSISDAEIEELMSSNSTVNVFEYSQSSGTPIVAIGGKLKK